MQPAWQRAQRAGVTEAWLWAVDHDKRRRHSQRRRCVIAGVLFFADRKRLDRSGSPGRKGQDREKRQ